jgi:hypothetical protein
VAVQHRIVAKVDALMALCYGDGGDEESGLVCEVDCGLTED